MTHIVQPGDTLWSIAARYGVTVEALMRANNLTNPNYIFLGQTLVIPSTGGFPLPFPTPGPSPQPGAGLAQRVARLERQYTTIEAELDRQIRRINRLEQRVRQLEG